MTEPRPNRALIRARAFRHVLALAQETWLGRWEAWYPDRAAVLADLEAALADLDAEIAALSGEEDR